MELRQLRYFLAIADNGSLSKASAVLGGDGEPMRGDLCHGADTP